jgi:hypothetical protein
MPLGDRQSHKQRPPILDEGNLRGRQLTPFQMLCHIAAPSSLVLEFINPILHVRPVTIVLGGREDLIH